MRSRRSNYLFWFTFCLDYLSVNASVGQQLSILPFISRYEPLDYELRPGVAHGTVQFTVVSLNRTLHIELSRMRGEDTDHLGTGPIIDVDGQRVKIESHAYTGQIRGDANSTVYGTVMDGLFVGHIRLFEHGRFSHLTIERTPSVHFGERFHSIIYSDGDISLPSTAHHRSKRQASISSGGGGVAKTCGLTDELYADMQRVQQEQPARGDGDEGKSANENFQFVRSRRMWSNEWDDSGNVGDDSLESDPIPVLHSLKHKRPTYPTVRPLHQERTCTLYLQTDHTLYNEIFLDEGGNDHKRTREVINGMLEAFVASLNQIFESIDFNGVRGVNFAIRRISIYTDQSCSRRHSTNQMGSGGSGWNPFCEENVRDASRMLDLNAMLDHSAYCLAYVFTARSFEGGTLGLAWVAGESPLTSGGICHSSKGAGLGSIFQQQSLNTGIVSMMTSDDEKVPLRTTLLTFAHEVGHSFGAQHDGEECGQPSSKAQDGDYLMTPTNTPGDMPNNDKFSRCSIKAMSVVLHEVLKHPPQSSQPSSFFRPLVAPKRNCFEARTTPFCGNQMVEEGEQCDCGYSQSDCDGKGDVCCEPRLSRFGPCTRRWRAACSPSEGPCCDAATCGFKNGGGLVLCREATECAFKQFCDGRSARCPRGAYVPDGTPCEDVTKACKDGACNGSICESVGLEECTLARGGIYRLCHLACIKDGVCRSSFELDEFAAGNFVQSGREGRPGILLRHGTSCGSQSGHCDDQYRCREGNASPNPFVVIKEFLVDVLEGTYRWVKKRLFND